jgi:hypothetical protein
MWRLALAFFVVALAVALLWLAPDSASALEPDQDTGNLATIVLTSAVGKAGDVVTVHGASFQPEGPEVILHLKGGGKQLTQPAKVDKAGKIQVSFTMPEGIPGYYIIEALQRDARGINAYGTPALASFQILGRNGQSVVSRQETSAESTVPYATSSSGVIALTVGLSALGISLYGAGFIAFVRQARGIDVPITASVRRN